MKTLLNLDNKIKLMIILFNVNYNYYVFLNNYDSMYIICDMFLYIKIYNHI